MPYLPSHVEKVTNHSAKPAISPPHHPWPSCRWSGPASTRDARPAAGKSWLRLDPAALSKASGRDLGNLTQAGNDPTQALTLLKGASTDVREVGTEQVRGIETTHYKATIDLRKAAEQQSPEAKRQVERLIAQARVRSLPADVWVDDQGQLRKMQYTLKMRPKDTGQQQGSATVSTAMELFDFGTAAKVE